MPLVSAMPLLLIDVDGVLNPHVRPGTTLGAQYATHRIGGQVVRLTPSHGEWLNRLAELYELDDPGQGADEWAAVRAIPTLLVKPDGYDGWTEAEFGALVDCARRDMEPGING